jgi:pimeloyl-ACP methyl ester carboxylesterase
MDQPAAAMFPAFKSEESRARYDAAYEAVLRGWPVAYEEIDLPTRLGPTHVIASGPPDAPPLVLLPSLAGTATVWRPNVEALSRHFRTYAVDVIGQTGRSLATRPIRDRHEFAGWLANLLDALGIGKASIVGCSFGGFLAMNQAMLTPERVERVVLISPAGTFVGLSWRFHYAMRIRAPIVKAWRRLTGDRRAPSLADLQGQRAGLNPDDADWRTLMSVTLAEAAKLSLISPTVFSRRQLEAVRVPVLLLIGDRERLYDPAATLKLAMARTPGLQGAVVPGADHIAAMAQPDEVNARIISFLRG